MTNTSIFTPANPEVETATRVYWTLSSCLNGKLDIDVTVERALNMTSRALKVLGPHRKASAAVRKLHDRLIMHGGNGDIEEFEEAIPQQ